MKKNKVFFTDDHAALRDGLAGMINTFKNFESVGVASNGQEAVAAFENGLLADIIILDLNMPVMDGYMVAEWLAVHRPAVKIIIMTMGVEKNKLLRLLAAGVIGIISKDATFEQMKEALDTVAAGGHYYSESVAGDINAQVSKDRQEDVIPANRHFTENDIEFLKLCATDLTYKEIGDKMGISKNTIELIRVKLFAALNTKNRTKMAIYAVKNGIVQG